MKQLIKNFIGFIYSLIVKWRGNLYHFKKAVRKARCAKKRSYVCFIGGRYRVLNRKDIQHLKNTGVFKRNINVRLLSGICLFDSQEGVLRHPNPKYNHFKL